MACGGNAVYAQPLRLERPAGAVMRQAPSRRGGVAADAGCSQRLPSPGELFAASGGSLARAGPALLRLQREQGNRHVQRVVAAARRTRRDPAVIQRRPVLGQPDDRYERAAELTAGQVAGRRPVSGIERVVDSGAGTARVDPRVQTEIGRARGSGMPLPDGIRRSMGQAYGADFSAVRTHSDARADQLTRSLDALAFTTGRDIFFRRGAYAPAGAAGQQLLAHELTHVIQQGGAVSPGWREPGRRPPERIQRYLFGGIGRYPGIGAFRTAMGGQAEGRLDDLWQSLAGYEQWFPQERGLAKNTNMLSAEEAGRARDLLIRILEAIDGALLDGGAQLSHQETEALERLRVHTQHELSIMVTKAETRRGSHGTEPSRTTRERIRTDSGFLIQWLSGQPDYRKWEWGRAGDCFAAAKEITEWLRDSVFNEDAADKDRVKTRGIVAYPPLTMIRAPTANHFVTVVDFGPGAGKVVVDPTMSQFLGCRKPLIGWERAWKKAIGRAKVDFGSQHYSKPSYILSKDFSRAGDALTFTKNPPYNPKLVALSIAAVAALVLGLAAVASGVF